MCGDGGSSPTSLWVCVTLSLVCHECVLKSNGDNFTFWIQCRAQCIQVSCGPFTRFVNKKRIAISFIFPVHFQVGAFRGLPQLTYLSLRRNALTELLEDTFEGAPLLQELELQVKPWFYSGAEYLVFGPVLFGVVGWMNEFCMQTRGGPAWVGGLQPGGSWPRWGSCTTTMTTTAQT